MSTPDLSGARRLGDLDAWVGTASGADAVRQVARLGDAVRASVEGRLPADLAASLAAGGRAMIAVLEDTPEGPVLDVFGSGGAGTEAVVAQRAESLDVLTRGAVALTLDPSGDERLAGTLLHTAFGADAVSAAKRRHILGTRWPGDPAGPDVRVPVADEKLQQAVIWGTINELLRSLQRYGAALGSYAGWAGRARAHADGITAVTPPRGCAGTLVTLHGSGFGQVRPENTTVRMATATGCREATIVSWSDTEVVVRAPADAGVGCAGFLVTAGDPPADPRGAHLDATTAAGMLQSVLGDAFGRQGVLYGQIVVDGVARAEARIGDAAAALPCPPCLPAAAGVPPNHFAGGPPVVHEFTVNGGRTATIRPGDTVTLHWRVDNADAVTVSVRTAEDSPWPAEAPEITAPDVAVAVPYEGFDDWAAEYVLTATNPCGTVEAPVAARVEMREPPPLFGLADTHVHFANHVTFGGYGIWGLPHANDPALPPAAAMALSLPHCDSPGGHGPGGVLPSLEGAVTGHLVGGWPQFDGWPRYTTLAHQQAYVDWIRRAVDGGLRLAVCLAANNEMYASRMSQLRGDRLPFDDVSTMIRQLDAVQAMVDHLDAVAGGPGQGWMRIARTPAEARRIVAAGKLAIVLGIEVDSPGGWHTPAALERAAEAAGKTPQQLVAEMVDDLYRRGVRHVFPVHATNNAFGGRALFVREYDGANYYTTGASFEVESADPALGISYRLDTDAFTNKPAELLAYYGAGGLGEPTRPCPPKPVNWAAVDGGHINKQGLTTYGETLLDELMKRGMVIDVDHMGHHTTEATLTRCESRRYPVVSGHTGVRSLKYGDGTPGLRLPGSHRELGTANPRRLAGEIDKSDEQIERIRRLGGMVSAITFHDHVRDYSGAVPANDSAGSSKTFAQVWTYVHDRMHGRRCGFGTDIDGAGKLPGPRFGPQGAGGLTDEKDWRARLANGWTLRADQVHAQHDGVRYVTPPAEFRETRYPDYAGSPPRAPFTAEQRDFWEALVVRASGNGPDTAEQPALRPIATRNFVINLGHGLGAASRADLPVPLAPFLPWPFFQADADVQLGAWLAAHPDDPARPGDPARARELAATLGPVFAHWTAMTAEATGQGTDGWTQQRFGPGGSGLYDATGRLHRCTAGDRDFDLNMDGMAHYGLLPDLLQDMRNTGVRPETMAGLYRSAEDYIRVWELCGRRRPA